MFVFDLFRFRFLSLSLDPIVEIFPSQILLNIFFSCTQNQKLKTENIRERREGFVFSVFSGFGQFPGFSEFFVMF